MARHGARLNRKATGHTPHNAKSVRIDGITYPNQSAAIVALSKQGRTPAWIANRLGCQPKTIYSALQKARDFDHDDVAARADLPAYKAMTRPCIRCRRPFPSEWKGNRMCVDCKRTTAGMAI